MAVLKSLFAIQNRFSCRNDGLSNMARIYRRLAFRLRWPAGLALVCLACAANGYGAGQQAAAPAATTKPAVGKEPSQQAVELVNQGNGLLDRKDFSRAEAAYQKAIQIDPAFAAAHRGLGLAFWRQRELGQAWQELNTVASLEPESGQAHYELGQLAWSVASGPGGNASATAGLSTQDFRAIALSEIQKAASLEPHNFSMRLDLSEIELEAGQKKEAQADALGAIPLATNASERARAHVALARAYSATGDELRAEGEYKKAIGEEPSSGAAYLGLGQISLSERNPAQAQRYFTQAIQISPGLGSAYAALGQLYIQAHQRGEALQMLQKAVALDPDDWQSQYELGKLLLASGQSARARDLFTKILAGQPDFLPAGEQLALLQLHQGDVQGAMAQGQRLVARNPHAAEGHRVLALVFWRQKQSDASLAECAQALAVDPHSTSMLALQALVLWQTKRRKDARMVLREVARGDPSILSPVTFCRQIVCGSDDVPLVGEFLSRNRWILGPPDAQ
jgi:tetratricopeptide (TPR) repeat protein